MYEFYPDYVDLCHPNHPDCVTGVTCSNCLDTWNPEIDVAGVLVTFSNELLITSLKEAPPAQQSGFTIDPNPSDGMVTLTAQDSWRYDHSLVRITNLTGFLQRELQWDGTPLNLDLTGLPAGIYLVTVITREGSKTERLIIQ
jgi:hypothetical protein